MTAETIFSRRAYRQGQQPVDEQVLRLFRLLRGSTGIQLLEIRRALEAGDLERKVGIGGFAVKEAHVKEVRGRWS